MYVELDDSFQNRKSTLLEDSILHNDTVKLNRVLEVLNQGSTICAWKLGIPEEMAGLVERKIDTIKNGSAEDGEEAAQEGANIMLRAEERGLDDERDSEDMEVSVLKYDALGHGQYSHIYLQHLEDESGSESNDSLTYSELRTELKDAKEKAYTHLPINITPQGVENIKESFNDGIQEASNPQDEHRKRIGGIWGTEQGNRRGRNGETSRLWVKTTPNLAKKR